MAIYTNIQSSDLKVISEKYGIEIIEFKPITGGNANTSYQLKTNRWEYILTIAEERSLLEMKALATLLQWLKKHDFATSEVVFTVTGELVTELQGKAVLLKKWISGKVYEDLSHNMLQQIGISLAQLHQVPAPENLPRLQSYGLQSFMSSTNKGIDLEYESWLKDQFTYFNNKLPKGLLKGLIHGDLFFDNIIIQNGELKAIIDFEEACYYFLVFDLGMSIVGFCRTDGKIDISKVKSFIKGYEVIRLLEALEKEYLQLFVDYAATATSNWRFCKYNILSPNPDLKNKHLEMVQLSNEIKSIPNDRFLSFVFD